MAKKEITPDEKNSEKKTFRLALVLSGEQGEAIMKRLEKAGMLAWRKNANSILKDVCDKAGI